MVVGDRRLTRIDEATRDLVERVDGKRRSAVRCGQEIGIHAKRVARLQRALLLVHAMRPDDLFGGGQIASDRVIGKLDKRMTLDRGAELAPPGRDDSTGPAKFVLFGRERFRVVDLALGDVGDLSRVWIERELVVVARVGDRLGTLHHVQPEIQRVAAKDVAHVVAADDHHLAAGFFGDAFQASRTHFAGRSDGESVAGDDKRLAAMDACAEVGHQIAKGAGLPTLVKSVERLGHAIGGGCDLVGVDGVAFLPVLRTGEGRIPENQRLATDEPLLRQVRLSRRGFGDITHSRTWPEGCTTNYVHLGRS